MLRKNSNNETQTQAKYSTMNLTQKNIKRIKNKEHKINQLLLHGASILCYYLFSTCYRICNALMYLHAN